MDQQPYTRNDGAHSRTHTHTRFYIQINRQSSNTVLSSRVGRVSRVVGLVLWLVTGVSTVLNMVQEFWTAVLRIAN